MWGSKILTPRKLDRLMIHIIIPRSSTENKANRYSLKFNRAIKIQYYFKNQPQRKKERGT